MIRDDQPDLVYLTQKDKFEAIIEDIRDCVKRGSRCWSAPTSIETSELLAKLLDEAKPAHEVLNAKQHEREAQIVAEAGRPGAVTIATNMAGRGTDIVLGGNLEVEISSQARRARRRTQIEAQRAEWQAAPPAGARGRRAAHHRHRAPRVAPYRQPVARTLRSAGRSGLVAASTCRWKTT
jgi:preprotein translocase subunit SecA